MQKMMTVGLAMALAAGSAAVAAAQGMGAAPQAPQRHEWNGAGRGERGGPGALLKGITLSDAQKAQLEQFRKSQRAKFQAEGKDHREDFQKMRDARQKGDTAAANAMRREFREHMEKRREAQIAEIRGILTPDQRKQFDANVAEWKQHQAQREHDGHHGRRGQPGQEG